MHRRTTVPHRRSLWALHQVPRGGGRRRATGDSSLSPMYPADRHKRCLPRGGRSILKLCSFVAVVVILERSRNCCCVRAFEGFSSFTFGSVPGGEPRFSFDRFATGGLGGMGGGGNVDNEGYYKILEVGKNADTAAITKAYRKLAKTKHPDKGGNPEEFKLLAEAYEVLSDSEKRRVYDRLGRDGVQGVAGAGGGVDPRQQADLFRSFFGRFSQPQPPRMRDVVYEMEVSLEDLYAGGPKKIAIRKEGDDGGDAKEIEISLRKGMRSGHHIVIEGGVEPIEEGVEPGDLVFVLREARHPVFRRLTAESPHLVADVTITLAEALTGFARPITLLDGRNVFYGPTQGEIMRPGAVLKMAGSGMPTAQGPTGDLYIRFDVEFPRSQDLGDGDRRALRELLPSKPTFRREKRNRPVTLRDAEPSIQSRFDAGAYDQPKRGPSRQGVGSPFGFFGL